MSFQRDLLRKALSLLCLGLVEMEARMPLEGRQLGSNLQARKRSRLCEDCKGSTREEGLFLNGNHGSLRKGLTLLELLLVLSREMCRRIEEDGTLRKILPFLK
jgi:hypothetical protein